MLITFDTNEIKAKDVAIIKAIADALAVQSDAPSVEAAAPAPTPAAKRRGRPPRKEVEVVEEPEAADAAEPEPDQLGLPEIEPEPEAADKELTLDDVRSALQQFTAVKGITAGVALLRSFNAGRISELAADNYAAFVKECAA